jgi:hypothetical protein
MTALPSRRWKVPRKLGQSWGKFGEVFEVRHFGLGKEDEAIESLSGNDSKIRCSWIQASDRVRNGLTSPFFVCSINKSLDMLKPFSSAILVPAVKLGHAWKLNMGFLNKQFSWSKSFFQTFVGGFHADFSESSSPRKSRNETCKTEYKIHQNPNKIPIKIQEDSPEESSIQIPPKSKKKNSLEKTPGFLPPSHNCRSTCAAFPA